MGIRKYRPITPGTRIRVASDFAEVTGRGRERGLVVAKHQRKAVSYTHLTLPTNREV